MLVYYRLICYLFLDAAGVLFVIACCNAFPSLLGRYYTKQFLTWGSAAALIGVLMLQLSPIIHQGISSQPGQPAAAGEQVVDQRVLFQPSQPEDAESRSRWEFGWAVSLSVLGIVIGTLLLILGVVRHNRTLQNAGAASIVLSALSHPSFFSGAKMFEKPEFKIEKMEFNFGGAKSVQTRTPAPGFQPLPTVNGFLPGDAEINGAMRAEIRKEVCGRLKEERAKGEVGTVMVIGGTDRVPLSAQARETFTSNFELAEARAEKAREEILQCEVPPLHVFTLSAGAREFSDFRKTHKGYAGADKDRRAEFWVLWQPIEGGGEPPDKVKEEKPPGKLRITGLDIFGWLSAAFMLVFYALGEKRPIYCFGLGICCLLTALYGILQGSSWVFIILEVVWAGVAFVKGFRGPERDSKKLPVPLRRV
jgi:hypothetical protein